MITAFIGKVYIERVLNLQRAAGSSAPGRIAGSYTNENIEA
jgi:hypothetical protein